MKEGSKTYRYGYLDKVLSVREGRKRRTFTYHADGQLATATRTGGPRSVATDALFIGKPHVDGLGYAFLFRNYRPSLGKWQTADPLGYPDGWNRLAYGVNSPMSGIDFLGASWGNWEMLAYYFRYVPEIVSSSAGISPLAAALWGIRVLGTNDYIDTDVMGLTNSIYNAMIVDAKRSMNDYVRRAISGASGRDSKSSHSFIVDCECIVFALGSGSGILLDPISWSWYTSTESFGGHLYEVKYFEWSYYGDMKYSDSFADPVDILNWLHAPNIEVPGGVPYSYGHLWENISLNGQGKIYRLLE